MKKIIYLLSVLVLITIVLIITNAVTYPYYPDLSELFDWFFEEEQNLLAYINIFIGIIWCVILSIYAIQIIIVISGLCFNLFKQKLTVKYLLIPFGFLFILKDMYKELK